MKSARSVFAMSLGGLMLVAACSSSSSSGNGGAPVATTPAPVDGGIPCGLVGGCAPPEECCLADPTAPTCVSQGACGGSSLACSSSKQCASPQICCFAYGPAGDASAAARPFSAQCADVCPSGDSLHYQLCAATSECVGGTCVVGPVAAYCMEASGSSPFPDLSGPDAG